MRSARARAARARLSLAPRPVMLHAGQRPQLAVPARADWVGGHVLHIIHSASDRWGTVLSCKPWLWHSWHCAPPVKQSKDRRCHEAPGTRPPPLSRAEPERLRRARAQEIRDFLIFTQQVGVPLPLSAVFAATLRTREVLPKLTIYHSTMLFKGLKYYAGVPGVTDVLKRLTIQARSHC